MLERPRGTPAGLLVLGHGAGGGVDTADLRAARDSALSAGWAVARVLQPYRVAGRRSPAPAPRLDEAWLAVLGLLRREKGLGPVPLVVGGRSSGARVACRTAGDCGAAAVLALAFPLHPPGRPERDRGDELRAVSVPVLVVQGTGDAFGGPAAVARAGGRHVEVRAAEGADHALRSAAATSVVAAATTDVLALVSRRGGR